MVNGGVELLKRTVGGSNGAIQGLPFTLLTLMSSPLKTVAWTPRPSENQLETDGRGVHPTVLQHPVS